MATTQRRLAVVTTISGCIGAGAAVAAVVAASLH
jgi:hypothetical protein